MIPSSLAISTTVTVQLSGDAYVYVIFKSWTATGGFDNSLTTTAGSGSGQGWETGTISPALFLVGHTSGATDLNSYRRKAFLGAQAVTFP